MKRIARATLVLGHVLDRIGLALVWVAAALLGAMAVLINVEVIGRYAVGFSTLIADEYSGYLFAWMTMLCFIFALRQDRMLKVETALRAIPLRGRNAAMLISGLVGLIVALVLAYATWQLLSINWLFGSVSLQPSRTPIWIPQMVMPIGFVLLAIAYLERFLLALLHLTGHVPQKATA